MDYRVLYDEVDKPQYAAMTSEQVAAALNARTIQMDRDVVESWEVLDCIVPAEFAALSAAEKTRVQMILGCGRVNLRGANTRASLGAAFGAGTTTRGNLVALQSKPISRGEELGIGKVEAGDVARVRGGRW